MSKTHAFAFRDFDKRKILQRPIFKHVEVDGEHFLEGNKFIDDEVINSLRATDDVNENETNLKKLQAIYEKLVYYQVRLIDRIHLPRLVRLKRATKNPELRKRAENLREEYDDDATQVTMTSAWVKKEIEKLEKIIQEQNRNIFASRLKQARQAAGLTQQQLAEKIGFSRAGLTQFENNIREPSLLTAINLARRLNVSLDWLVGISTNTL